MRREQREKKLEAAFFGLCMSIGMLLGIGGMYIYADKPLSVVIAAATIFIWEVGALAWHRHKLK